jgi:hypothetical protein
MRFLTGSALSAALTASILGLCPVPAAHVSLHDRAAADLESEVFQQWLDDALTIHP